MNDFSHIRLYYTGARITVRTLLCILILASVSTTQSRETKSDPLSSPPKNILVLYSFDDSRLFAPLESLKSAIRERVPGQVNFFVEYMETQRLEDPNYEKTLSENLKTVYGTKHLDLVITAVYPALHFALTHRDELFPGTPIIFSYVNQRRVAEHGVWPGTTGVTTTVDISGTVDLILRLQPDTQNIALVAGVPEFERFWAEAVRKELHSRADGVRIIDLVGLSTDELLSGVSKLPPHTAIVYLVMPKMSEQLVMGSYEIGRTIGGQVPTYCIFGNYCLDKGGVGGSIPDYNEQSTLTAQQVAHLFSGERPEEIPVLHDSGARPVVDWRQVTRWKLSESSLPSGSVILFRPATLWQEHKLLISTGSAVIVLQLLLILRLLQERAKKSRILAALRESDQRFRTMADSTPSLIWVSDAQGTITYLNRKTQEFTGANLETLRNEGWKNFVHPDDLATVMEANAKALQRCEGFSKIYRLRRHDGIYRWIFDVAAPRIGSDGPFCGFIGSCADITEQKLAEESLQGLTSRLIRVQEEERARIARELHDDFSQRMAVQHLELAELRDRLAQCEPAESSRIQKLLKNNKEISADLRCLSHRLYSTKLELVGLVPALSGLCQEISQKSKIAVDFTGYGSSLCLTNDAELCLFRVCQEALSNVVKHSEAKNAHVELSANGHDVSLRVRDEGKGFKKELRNPEIGMGIESMRERLRLVGGVLSVHSELMKGTEILAEVPMAISVKQAT